MSHLFFNDFIRSLIRRLPVHYKNRYLEAKHHKPIPVHQQLPQQKYEVLASGEIRKVYDPPLRVIYPKEADDGLWGGEGIVKGFMHNQKTDDLTRRYWDPRLLRRVFFSEILNRWMEITVTNRTLDLIDEAYGFDNYILQTHEVDLRSRLGMRLKREMLLRLARGSVRPEDPKENARLLAKYKEFIIPVEEAAWVGLSLEEAVEKQERREREQWDRSRVPLKSVFLDETIQQLIEDKTLAPSLATASASVNQAAPPLRLHERLIQKFERDFLKRK